MNPSRAQAIKKMLDAKSPSELASLYHPGMECQVNVAQDDGTRKDGYSGRSKHTFSDGITTWFSFRIPKNSWSEPKDNSSDEMTYPLFEHAEGIGLTGWCFSELRSRWVAFDFDSIVGHSDKHVKKMSDEELAKVKELACGIPWVEVRRSASGNGIHLYVYFEEPVPIKNHTEHAALGRAVLAEMSALAGFDFQAKVDTCGGNMWIWHRKMPKGGLGLSLVHKAEHPMRDVPKSWERYLRVVKGERKKSLPGFAADNEATFDETVGQQARVPLDAEHKSDIDWLQKNQGWGWWDSDHHMLVTHTWHLKRLSMSKTAFRGAFETSSPATQTEEQNCFCFPLRNGGWSVRRYSPGAAEHPSWEQDGKGWTRCFFNRDPDLRSAARTLGGVETAQGAFQFPVLDDVGRVCSLIGGSLAIPNMVASRPGRIVPHKDGQRVIVEVDQFAQDSPKEMPGWYSEKGKIWRTVVSANARTVEDETGTFDDFVRHCTNEARVDAGWFVKVGDGWNHEPKSHVGLALLSVGKKKSEADLLMGASVTRPWTIVSRPFEDEYPGDRMWNKSRVRFRYPRSEEIGDFSTWRRVLSHIGTNLTEALAVNGWALANDIKTGCEYLELWLASLFQDPYARRPYVFLWSEEQDTGKSTFHEMLSLLITDDGVVEANALVKGKDTFNGQMEGAVVCYIEELDLNKNRAAYERIKNWVTSPRISIRKLYIDAYQMPNTTSWIHCANTHRACAIFPGDSRVTMIEVPVIDPKNMIPKPELMELLKREAPHFLNHLLSLDVPPSGSRLAVPVISTSEKNAIAASTLNSLELFLDERCHYVPGKMLKFSEFYDKFREQLDTTDLMDWNSRNKVSHALPPKFPVGKKGPETYIGNLSWEPQDSVVKPRFLLKGRQLVSAAACQQGKCVRSVGHQMPHTAADGAEWS